MHTPLNVNMILTTTNNTQQAGFVKIIKKHDKAHPACPVWPLYVGHLQHQPWAHAAHADLWARVAAVFYEVHTTAAAAATAASAAATAAAAAAAASAANAAASAGARPASRQGGAPRPPSRQQAEPVQQQAVQQQQPNRDVTKFWVAVDDVPSVVYFILQHLPLLPAEGGAGGSGGNEGAFRAPSAAAASSSAAAPPSSSAAAASRSPSSASSAAAAALDVELPGCGAEVHTVYLDSCQSLELYHARLYLRPNARTLKVRWLGRGAGGGGGGAGGGGSGEAAASTAATAGGDDGGGSEGGGGDDGGDGDQGAAAGWAPRRVVVERKIYREGWKGEPNAKAAMLMAGDALPAYLAGAYTLGDALEEMRPRLVEVGASGSGAGGSGAAGGGAAAGGGGGAAGQGPPRRGASFTRARSAASALQLAAAAAAAAAAEAGQSPPAGGPFAAAAAAVAEAAAGAGRRSLDRGAGPLDGAPSLMGGDADAGPSGLWLPPGVAIGSPPDERAAAGLAAAADDGGIGGGAQPLLSPAASPARRSPRQSAAAAAPAAPALADLLLPLPASSDQLSLFSEVQRLVARRGLVPVLHCSARRLVFQMPFDASLRVTLDLDVRMAALPEADEPGALALAALAARCLRRALGRADARLRPDALLRRLRARAGAARAACDGEQQQQKEHQQQDGALDGAPDGSDGADSEEEAEEAEALSWDLWSRLYEEDLATSDAAYTLPYAVLKVRRSRGRGAAESEAGGRGPESA